MQGAHDFFFVDIFENKIMRKVFQYIATNLHKLINIAYTISIISYYDCINSLKYVGVCRHS